jgi:HlyD family secretion protein
MRKATILIFGFIFESFLSCSNGEKADGYGNFEATEITVSSEANGKILALNLEEGDLLEKGAFVGLVDTLQLHLTKLQLEATMITIASKSGNVWSQIGVLKEQLRTAQTEQERIQAMFAEKAATQRQVDEAASRVSILKKQIKNVETQNAPIVNELKSIETRVAQIDDQIEKSNLKNPISGTVLTKFAEASEVTSFGKPVYKLANLDEMILRVYVSENQLAGLNLGQKVMVKIDSEDEMKSFEGKISWISSTAEFTPKIIQTKEERVNLVYAVKVRVQNDGSLKIGMPAEMWLSVK